MMYDEYVDRVTEVVTGIVQQAGDRNNVLVDLGKVEALLPRSEQVDGERYEQGSRIKAVITEVRSGTKGPQVILSRRDPELIRTLFELEVPEIADGLVEIRGVAREPGYRSKIAVESHAQGVDPVGACVGPRGSRVRMVVSELRGEKIDIIPWNTEPARFIAKALSPARVREVLVDDETKEATVIVPEDQLALAIGKEGLNARLAARLTGWKVDIQSDAEFAQAEAEAAFAGGDRRRGVLRPLRRRSSPTASAARTRRVPGSRFCGIPAHRELAEREAAGEELEASQVVGGVSDERARGGAAEEDSKRGRAVAEEPPVEETTEGPGADEQAAESRSPLPSRSPTSRRRHRSSPKSRSPSRSASEEETSQRRVSSAPIRTCAGCGRKAPKGELIRFVAPDGALTPGRTRPGEASTRAGGSSASSGRPPTAASRGRCARPSASIRSSPVSTLEDRNG